MKGRPRPFWCGRTVPALHWDWWRFDRQGPRPVPWAYPYQNTYLNHMGGVFKFGPEGGKIYGFSGKPRVKKGEPAPPTPALADVKNAPAAAADYVSGNLKRAAKITGAAWRYGGIGPIPSFDFGWGDPGCICWNSRLAVDPYGRVYAPNVFRFCVEMLDTNGNRIARIGGMGIRTTAWARNRALRSRGRPVSTSPAARSTSPIRRTGGLPSSASNTPTRPNARGRRGLPPDGPQTALREQGALGDQQEDVVNGKRHHQVHRVHQHEQARSFPESKLRH